MAFTTNKDLADDRCNPEIDSISSKIGTSQITAASLTPFDGLSNTADTTLFSNNDDLTSPVQVPQPAHLPNSLGGRPALVAYMSEPSRPLPPLVTIHEEEQYETSIRSRHDSKISDLAKPDAATDPHMTTVFEKCRSSELPEVDNAILPVNHPSSSLDPPSSNESHAADLRFVAPDLPTAGRRNRPRDGRRLSGLESGLLAMGINPAHDQLLSKREALIAFLPFTREKCWEEVVNNRIRRMSGMPQYRTVSKIRKRIRFGVCFVFMIGICVAVTMICWHYDK